MCNVIFSHPTPRALRGGCFVLRNPGLRVLRNLFPSVCYVINSTLVNGTLVVFYPLMYIRMLLQLPPKYYYDYTVYCWSTIIELHKTLSIRGPQRQLRYGILL